MKGIRSYREAQADVRPRHAGWRCSEHGTEPIGSPVLCALPDSLLANEARTEGTDIPRAMSLPASLGRGTGRTLEMHDDGGGLPSLDVTMLRPSLSRSGWKAMLNFYILPVPIISQALMGSHAGLIMIYETHGTLVASTSA